MDFLIFIVLYLFNIILQSCLFGLWSNLSIILEQTIYNFLCPYFDIE